MESRHHRQSSLRALLGFLSVLFSLFAFENLRKTPLFTQADNATSVRVGWYPSAGLQDGQKDEDLGGYNFEYLSKIAQYARWKYEFVYDTWANLETALIAGKIDVLGDVAQTSNRKEKYDFCTYPNGYSRMLMITRGNDYRYFYNDYEAFNGMKVATIASSFRKSLLDREANEHHFTVNYLVYPSDEAMFAALD